MLEGSRTFDILYGTIAGATCFSIGLCAIFSWMAARRTNAASIFGGAADPGRGLQLAWGIFAMAMGGTNIGCRYVDHRYLSGVHEGFFMLTLLVIAVLVPRLVVSRLGVKVLRVPREDRSVVSF